MKAYVVTTGLVFLLIVVAHGARLISEGPHLLKQPTFLLTSVLCIALSGWAWRVSSLIQRRKNERTPVPSSNPRHDA